MLFFPTRSERPHNPGDQFGGVGEKKLSEDEDDDEYEDDKHASSRPYADTHQP